ncbi:MAG: hypothetical protein K8I27_08640 [Planctomycetes bacterium]|nr:hypothetical protein [Planctomycetota bacterium]
MRILPFILLALLFTACMNAPEIERDNLRRGARDAEPEQHEAKRAELRTVLGGGADSPRDADPHLRATAAQGLGMLGYADDYEALLDALLGPLADENMLVRMECAIALGKLAYSGRTDERRLEVILQLRRRVAFERDDNGRLFETEFLVRSAMLNSLIAIGGRDSAAAIHDIASRIHSDLESTEAVFTSASDRGLLDRCFQGLAALTGVPLREAADNRFASDDLTDHIDWWASRISEMPE